MTTRQGRAPRRAPTITRPVGLSPAMRAQHALYDAGLELAGVRLQRFAEGLLQAVDACPGASCAQLIKIALRQNGDDSVALVAEEPQLHTRRLGHAVMNVSEAAETALEDLARVLLNADTV